MTSPAEDIGTVVSLNTAIGPYTITKFLGAGAWKQTFEARRADGTRWALKFHAPTQAAQQVAAGLGMTNETFWKKECRNGNSGSDYLASQMLETYGGHTFLAEELLDATLEDRLNRGREYNENEVLDIALHLARGLAEFHRKFHVPHGDLKPANVGFSGDKVKIFDYGTATVHLLGRGAYTPYRAPETFEWLEENQRRFHDREYAYATDIWSYGAILYRLITGKDLDHSSCKPDDRNIEIHQQLGEYVKNKKLRALLYRCINAYESRRIRDGTELQEYVEDIIESKKVRNKLLKLVMPTVKYLSFAIAGGIIAAQCQDTITNPQPPVRLELPTVEARYRDNQAALAEGFSVLYQEERQSIIDKMLERRRQPLPPLVFGMEDIVYGKVPEMLTIGNEIRAVTQYQHTATLVNAYENAIAYFGKSFDRSNAFNVGSYILTDYQIAMYDDPNNTYSSDPYGGRRLIAKIVTRNTAQLAEQRAGGAYVDLEDVCTASLVGTTLMYQAMLAAQESGTENFRDFSVYIDAQRDGQFIIPHDKIIQRYGQDPISVADFLKVFVQYAHQSAVPVQDFQPLVLSE